jgi:uncharacterized protein involved in exopolysaccharide biosynthesis
VHVRRFSKETRQFPIDAKQPPAFMAGVKEGGEVDLAYFLHLVLRFRGMIIGLCAVVVIGTMILLLLTPNRYTSRATILPSTKNQDLSGLKAMAGLAGFHIAETNTSALYPVILKSRHIQEAVTAKRYSFSNEGQKHELTLQEYFAQDNPDRLRAALAGITDISSDSRTGEIAVAVETEYPRLSQAIVQEYLDELEAYNLHKRRSSARENEQYLARQLVEARQKLEAAEDSLEQFRLANADWARTGSPEVLKQHGRLERDVQMNSSIYLLLQQQHEMAKLEAQKDLPIVRILDQPSLPTVKSGPFRAKLLVLTAILAFFLTVGGVVVADLTIHFWRGSTSRSRHELKGSLQNSFPRTVKFINRARSNLNRSSVVEHK